MISLLISLLIDINTASIQQLDQLTGIGPKYAQGIIDARPFSSVDDLDRVKGIGPKTVEKIKSQGLACVNCTTAPATQPAIKSPAVNTLLPKTEKPVKINTETEINQKQNPWFLFVIALAITIISAGVVLFIKLKIQNNHVRT